MGLVDVPYEASRTQLIERLKLLKPPCRYLPTLQKRVARGGGSLRCGCVHSEYRNHSSDDGR